MEVDPEKLRAMIKWPQPQSIKDVRAFLGIIGYYQKFVEGYGSLVAPMSALLKKGACEWDGRGN